MMKQSRWRSKGAWVSVAALVMFLLKNYGLFQMLGLTDQSFSSLVDLVFAMLMAFGFFNNPTNKDGF